MAFFMSNVKTIVLKYGLLNDIFTILIYPMIEKMDSALPLPPSRLSSFLLQFFLSLLQTLDSQISAQVVCFPIAKKRFELRSCHLL